MLLDVVDDLSDHARFGGLALLLVIVVVIVVRPEEDTMVLVFDFLFPVGGGLGISAVSSSCVGSSLTVWEGCEATASSEVPGVVHREDAKSNLVA